MNRRDSRGGEQDGVTNVFNIEFDQKKLGQETFAIFRVLSKQKIVATPCYNLRLRLANAMFRFGNNFRRVCSIIDFKVDFQHIIKLY